jgi:LPXTG-site transpeptidase (sortase) family protein
MKQSLQNMNAKLSVLCIVFILLLFPLSGTASADKILGSVTRVSIAPDGTEANNHSHGPSISYDGRFIAFNSPADNIVPDDSHVGDDVYLHDQITGLTNLISVSSSGEQGNAGGHNPTVSGDGIFIAFESMSTNIVPGAGGMYFPGGPTTLSPKYDIFIHNRISGTTETVSVSTNGIQGNGQSNNAAISGDGRYVVFHSNSDNLVPNDSNGSFDIFLHDRNTNSTERISLSSGGVQGNDESYSPSISSDGRFIVFNSLASNLITNDTNNASDVFLHDRITGTTSRISVSSSGVEGSGRSVMPNISGDGRIVVFWSEADNLVEMDTNNVADIFAHDLATGITSRVSISTDGEEANGQSLIYGLPAISHNGYLVVFQSEANNLMENDVNSSEDLFLHNLETGETERVSLASDGTPGNRRSSAGVVSGNGCYVSFSSEATNLVSNDNNNRDDVFLLNLCDLDTAALPATGFPFGQNTSLPEQPSIKDYSNMNLELSIPSLEVRVPILGIPQNENGWDVTWLNGEAGYLYGSSFPTWAGNTVITGHVWNVDNSPGIFKDIKELKYGDQFNIHAYGQTFTYEVRESRTIETHEVEDVFVPEEYDWVTLLTCEHYNPLTSEYNSRRMVRAVLVSVN